MSRRASRGASDPTQGAPDTPAEDTGAPDPANTATVEVSPEAAATIEALAAERVEADLVPRAELIAAQEALDNASAYAQAAESAFTRVEAERDEAREGRAAARMELAEARSELARMKDERDQARDELAALRAELHAAQEALDAAVGALDAACTAPPEPRWYPVADAQLVLTVDGRRRELIPGDRIPSSIDLNTLPPGTWRRETER